MTLPRPADTEIINPARKIRDHAVCIAGKHGTRSGTTERAEKIAELASEILEIYTPPT